MQPTKTHPVTLTCPQKRREVVSPLPKADRGLKVFGLSKKRKQSLWLCSWVEGIKCQQVTILQTTDDFNFAHVIYWHFLSCVRAHYELALMAKLCETVRATTEHTAGSIFWPTADTGNDHYLERNKERRAGTKWSKGQERSGQLWFEFLSWRDDSWADVCRVVRQSCWNRLNLNVLSVSKINHGCGFFSPKG